VQAPESAPLLSPSFLLVTLQTDKALHLFRARTFQQRRKHFVPDGWDLRKAKRGLD
jgi:hypothetical protein